MTTLHEVQKESTFRGFKKKGRKLCICSSERATTIKKYRVGHINDEEINHNNTPCPRRSLLNF